MIGKELASLIVLAKNIYNIDKIGVLLSILNSLKVLISRHKLKTHRGVGVTAQAITS